MSEGFAIALCNRCHKIIPRDDAEFCWYCMATLCSTCWDDVGHCGHPEADAINARIREHHRRESEDEDAAQS